ncbi:SDR family oxidoreductase [Nocardia sp. NPDC056000]|uniref:SDR family oxidoreductase n=1 Tax=Nocardia sp. NPDC056000 TaxID=3345674 RepID=UPI0035D90B7D
MRSLPLREATVAITGGARGIGYASAKAFAAKGASVFIGDLDGDFVESAGAAIGVRGLPLDVRCRDSFAAFLSAVGSAGRPLDVLVNNAGIMPIGEFVEEDDGLTDSIIDVNVRGVLNGTKLVLPGMIARGRGHVVNVASYVGKIPTAGAATYCASKFAVVGFSEAIRDEVAGTGVTVTAILPGAVRTELAAGVRTDGLPTVDPQAVADAIVDSCRYRQAIVAVPGWMRQYELAAALLPDPLIGAVRGRLTRYRARATDLTARRAYDERIHRLTE